MDFSPSEEQQLVLEAVRGLASRLGAEAAQWDADDRIAPEARLALAEMGLGGLFLPESAGGAGFGTPTGVQALELLGEASGALALRFAAHAAGALPCLALAGTPPEEVAETAASGDWLALLPDPVSSGSSEAGRWRWVPGAQDAGAFVVRSDQGEVSIVDVRASGLERTPASGLGMRGAGLGHVRLEGAGPLRRVGSLAASAGRRVSALLRLAVASAGVGVGRAALAHARSYALERKQFGRPIAEFQAVQWMIADAATELDAASLLVLRAALLHDQGEGEQEAQAALVLATDATHAAAHRAIQIHGGNGFVREYPVERLARDARWLGVAFEGRDAARVALGRALLS
ncbi:MAG: acyl-CoA dehydrogenase family protein [Myxococcota bacterium]